MVTDPNISIKISRESHKALTELAGERSLAVVAEELIRDAHMWYLRGSVDAMNKMKKGLTK